MSRKLLFLSCLVLVLSAPVFAYEGQDLFGEYFIPAGIPTIDGVISPGEWDNANWLDLDQLYYGDPPDLSNARWAALWSPQTNLIYVVVTGTDTYHFFGDGYWSESDWNKYDTVQVYIDPSNSDAQYYSEQDPAQQWMAGNDNNGGQWIMLPVECIFPENPLDDEYRPQLATTINGDILTYEYAFKPYESFGWLTGRETKELQLEADLQVGLDVVMCSRSTTFGMLCENAWEADDDVDGDGIADGIVSLTKWNLASRFLDHWLILDPNQAWRPRPGYKTEDVPTEVTLEWNAGKNAAAHNIYFGDDFDSVNNADESSTDIYRTNQILEDTTYTPAEIPLELNKTYYWRIDEVNESDSSVTKGNIWSFTTINYLVVDDFESYSAINEIFDTWLDGWINDTGSWVSLETQIVRDGNSMRYNYSNDYYLYSYYSEAEAYIDDLQIGPDWTAGGAQILSLWFYGNAENDTEPMYLALEDSGANVGVSYYTDVNDIKIEQWQQWNVPLLQFADQGLDLTDVSKISIIFGNKNDPQPGGQGYVYFDDIRLYLPENTAYDPSPADGAVDIDPDITLTWTPGIDAASHDVYFGTDETAIENATRASLEFMGNVPVNTYTPWPLELGATYYWRIDEVNDSNLWPGAVWHFKTVGLNTAPVADAGEDLAVYAWYDGTAEVTLDGSGSYDPDDIAELPSDINLIGWWKLDEGTGEFTEDSSTYANDGNVIEASWTTGYPGDPCDSALHFDGDGVVYFDHVLCAERDGSSPGTYPAELMPDTFTVSCWTKLDNFEPFSAFIGNGIDTGSDECGFYFYNYGWDGENGQDFGLAIRTESAMNYVETENIYETDTWYHLAATYDGNYVSIYVDGLLAAGPTYVGGPMRWISAETGNYPQNFTIGAWLDPGYNLYVQGTIDDVRYYDYPMNQSEIAILAETAEVTLDSSDSSDPDGDELTYAWFMDGQEIATGVSPTISLPVGEHAIQLIVNDGLDDSEPDQVVITVEPAVEAVLEMMPGVLNCRKQGEDVKARLTLPEGYLPEDVDVERPVVLEPAGIESVYVEVRLDKQGLVVVEAGFERPALCEGLAASGDEFLEITAAGHLTSGQCFYGISTIKIMQ